mmetsp:Transcript_13992/g.35683  ORF Transcript_13992/g.35683 Transcript_13992/m.35683 type:complete len:96 (+) Transcript_13992:144-431(+)
MLLDPVASLAQSQSFGESPLVFSASERTLKYGECLGMRLSNIRRKLKGPLIESIRGGMRQITRSSVLPQSAANYPGETFRIFAFLEALIRQFCTT